MIHKKNKIESLYRTYKIATNKQINQATENVDHVAGLER